MSSKPLAIDLYAGLGGWAEGFLSEGFDVIGFDVERHDYGTGGYPGQLVIQDVLTLHGSQFKDAAVIVASPPCQEYSYMAMPWARAKQIALAIRNNSRCTGMRHADFPEGYTGSRNTARLNMLFDSCFRIQREAIAAAGRCIPLIVENVKGAQPWVGRSKANYGSFYLWGDVARVGNRVVAIPPRFGAGISPRQAIKNSGGSWFAIGSPGQANVGQNPDGRKLPKAISDGIRAGKSPARWTNPAEHYLGGIKNAGDWFSSGANCSLQRKASSRSAGRKAAIRPDSQDPISGRAAHRTLLQAARHGGQYCLIPGSGSGMKCRPILSGASSPERAGTVSRIRYLYNHHGTFRSFTKRALLQKAMPPIRGEILRGGSRHGARMALHGEDCGRKGRSESRRD